MTRYVTGHPASRGSWEDEYQLNVPTQTAHTSNDQHVDTGLVDHAERPIFRVPNRIGYRFGGDGAA